MTLKIVLCQCLSESISDLTFSVDRKNIDETFLNMFTKMMIAYADVLCHGSNLGKSCRFKCTRIILKDLAIHMGFGAEDLEILLPHFLQKSHDRNEIPECL